MQKVGRYAIDERIGQGAMADVFKAYDETISRPLAIKILKPEFRANAEYVSRFLREAKAAGALSHPNIVTIYDVGEVDGFPYIAMELLDGETLDQVIHRCGRLSPDTVLSIGRQLADALSYAHGAGIVHRDIKPSNIMLGGDGQIVKILDFGIARVIDADQRRHQAESVRTQVGQVLGTPRYMSPEQALGLHIDGRSDLFSVGVVLYEAVTGHTAFGGTTIATLALQITQSQPQPVTALVSDCPRGLGFIITKLLAKDPDQRFADGAALSGALRREQDSAIAAKDRGSTGWRIPLALRLSLVFGGVTAMALIGSISFVLDRQNDALRDMAMTSGSTITSFIANNAALRAAENAGLPEAEQDWAPVQAFIAAAVDDANIRRIALIDRDNVVRASSDPALIGTRYRAPRETLVKQAGKQQVTAAGDGEGAAGLRFRGPVEYAARPFGTVDVVVSRANLDSAVALSRNLLTGAGLLILALILLVSWAMARRITHPIARLRRALADAGAGALDFRISHRRHDEFGELFDGFNALIERMQQDGEPKDEEQRAAE